MARLLQQKGADVTVYEWDKDAQARIWGGTLDLHQGTGQDAMRAAGLLETYYALAIPMGRVIADEQGHVLLARKARPGERHNNPEINRNDLRKMLLESLHAGTVVWDSRLTALEPQAGKWLLHFDDQPDAVADVVIAANGGMSKVRGYVTDAEVEETGTFIVQGDVPDAELMCPEFSRLCAGDILMTANHGTMLVANPRNSGALTYGVVFKKPEAWDTGDMPDFRDVDSARDFLLRQYAGWGSCYHELFRATTFFAGLPTRKLPVDKPWKTARPLPITLIGDAAHLMPPFAGQGVNIGLVDAMTLSDNFTSAAYLSIEEAISAYEQKMLVYATEAQQDSSGNELEMRSPDFSLETFVKRFLH